MQQRDKTFRKYCNSKQTMTKGKLYGDFKNLKNQVIFLTCKLKSYFCKTFFENNKNNTTNIWTKIKQLITLKASNRRNLNFTSSYEKLIINSKILLLFLGPSLPRQIQETSFLLSNFQNDHSLNLLLLKETDKDGIGKISLNFNSYKCSSLFLKKILMSYSIFVYL